MELTGTPPSNPVGPPPSSRSWSAVTAAVLSFLGALGHTVATLGAGVWAVYTLILLGLGEAQAPEAWRQDLDSLSGGLLWSLLATVGHLVVVVLLITGGVLLLRRRRAGQVVTVVACAGALVLVVVGWLALQPVAAVYADDPDARGDWTVSLVALGVTIPFAAATLILATRPSTTRWCRQVDGAGQ